MTTFYEDMRDDTVKNMLTEFGIAATLRASVVTYAPATGVATSVDTDTAIVLLKLPIERPRLRNFFREELIERASYQFLVSASELAAAGVVPTSNDKVILPDGHVYAILGVNEVSPGPTTVLYKFLVEG